MPFPLTVSAPHVVCYMNGVMFGLIVGLPQWNIETAQREGRGIDSNTVQELIPGSFRVSGTFQVLRGRETGGLEGAGLVASGRAMLQQKYINIELVDRLTDTTLFKATRCAIDRQSWSVQPKGLVMGTFGFIGSDFENESKS